MLCCVALARSQIMNGLHDESGRTTLEIVCEACSNERRSANRHTYARTPLRRKVRIASFSDLVAEVDCSYPAGTELNVRLSFPIAVCVL